VAAAGKSSNERFDSTRPTDGRFMTTGEHSDMATQPVSRFRAFLPFLLDLVVPIVAYFVLHGLGVSDVVALTVGGLATGVNATIGTIRRRRLDGIGLLVVLEIALSIGLLFVTNDARILLIKPSFYVALAAIYAFITCIVGRPIGYEAAKPFASRGDPTRLAAYELAWERSSTFRRVERIVTLGWGLAFCADAILRVIVVFSFTPEQIGQSLVLSQLPGVAAIAIAVGITRRFVPTLRRIVEVQLEELRRQRAVPPPPRLRKT